MKIRLTGYLIAATLVLAGCQSHSPIDAKPRESQSVNVNVNVNVSVTPTNATNSPDSTPMPKPSPAPSSAEYTDLSHYLGMTRDKLVKELGIEFEEGTTAIEESHVIFPIRYYPLQGLTFVFGNDDIDSKVSRLILSRESNVKRFHIKGAKPGMTFKEVQILLGRTDVVKTWTATEDNKAYKIEYVINGLVYQFVSEHEDGSSSDLIILKPDGDKEEHSASLSYKNTKLGLSIQFPKEWKGK